MKACLRFVKRSGQVGTLSLLVTCTLAAAPAPPKNTAPQPSKPESAQQEAPQSVFVIPNEPKEGRDPFFPGSNRVYVNKTIIPIPSKANTPVNVVLTGISSGFAMINGRTFAPGETADVTEKDGRRSRVTCVEIKADSVIVEVGNERRELRLKSGLK
jgi:hypothetical protein